MKMRKGIGRLAGLAATACLIVGWGCGDGRPSVDTSTTEATVKGIVTVRGKPAAKCTISFDPSNIKRKSEPTRSAPIGDDGSYTITTLVGENQVRFTGPLFRTPEMQEIQIPFDVPSGESTHNFELPPTAAP